MNAKHTARQTRRDIVDAAKCAALVINCVEAARAEKRIHVALWWLDQAAVNRRRYAALRAAIAKATGEGNQ